MFLFADFPQVDREQRGEHHHEYDGEYGVPERLETLDARVGIDIGGQGVDSGCRTLVYLSDDEVVDGDDERHNESADDTGGNHREHNAGEGAEGIRAEVKRRFVHVGVHTLEFWHYAEHDVRSAESDVRDYQPEVSLGEGERHEEYHQRDRHNDFAVDYGKLVDVFHNPTGTATHTVNSDCSESAHNGGHHRRDDGDEQRVLDCRPQSGRFFGGEYGHVRVEREAVREVEVGTSRETVNDDEDYGSVEYRQNDEDVRLA